MCILDVVFESMGVHDSIIAIISLASMGSIAVILVYYFLSKPFEEINKKESKNRKRNNLINSIINLIIILVYLINSFIAGWEYTWIILIAGLLIKKIIFLIILLKSERSEVKNER